MFESWSKFIVDLVAWAAHACTGWISALDHEIINDPVENNTVIEPFSARSMKFWAVLGALSSKSSAVKSPKVVENLTFLFIMHLFDYILGRLKERPNCCQ